MSELMLVHCLKSCLHFIWSHFCPKFEVMFTEWLKSCLHVWGYVCFKVTTLRFLFKLCLRSYLQLCWKTWLHCFRRNVYTILKDILYHIWRHVYTLFEGMITQCLHIDWYKSVQNVSNDQKWLIIALISTNYLKWLS